MLYDKMVADDVVFDNHSFTQKLKQDFKNLEGISLAKKDRDRINQDANLKIANLDELSFSEIHENTVRSNVKRLLFYLGLAENTDTTYSPSEYRNALLADVASFSNYKNDRSTLEATLLQNVMDAAKNYAAEVKAQSGIEMIVAQLPPISALVIDKAIKCGSWTEAIEEIKSRQIAQHFREWAIEVSENLTTNSSTSALNKLKKVNSFIKGWGENEQGGLAYKVNFGIGAFLNTFGIPINTETINITVRNPFPKKHLVFLNDTFDSLISVKNDWNQIQKIKV